MFLVVLSATDFRDLVRGKVIEKFAIDVDRLSPPIELCLSDISLTNLRDILEEAMDDKWGRSLGKIQS
jgi:hypothetical protein